MSASIMAFIPIMPRRRINSGLLVISCGRRMILLRKKSMFSLKRSSASGLNDNAVAEADNIFPLRIKSNIPSCSTSVKPVRLSNGLSCKPASTAFATLPTPDCKGSRFFGSLPILTSCEKKSMICAAMLFDISSGSANLLLRSDASVRTIPAIFSKSQCR